MATVVAVAIGIMYVPALTHSVSALAQSVPVGATAGAAVSECGAAKQVAPAALPAAARPSGTRVCVIGETSNGATTFRTRSGIGTTAVSCPQTSWGIAREEVCRDRLRTLGIQRRFCDRQTGACVYVPSGTISFREVIRVTALRDDSGWTVSVQLKGTTAKEDGNYGLDVSATIGCDGACFPLRSEFPTQTLLPKKKISGSGTGSSTVVDGTGGKGIAHARVQVTYTALAPFPPQTPYTEDLRVDPDIRCDSIVQALTGCVFPGGGIVYDLVSTSFPEVARHVRLAQASGLVGADVPLHRTMKDDMINRNRDVSCPSPGPPRVPPRDSCDEYPFASTYEGAGRLGWGAGRTFPDCDRPDLPTGQTGALGWSACNLGSGDNSAQGRDLQLFYIRWRVLDSDDFYVEVT